MIQPDGKIVVAGTTAPNGGSALSGQMVLKRFRANGAVDHSFGSGGTTRLRGSVAAAVALGRGGTIIVGGSIPGRDGSPRVALARLRNNGKPDGSFGSGGFAEVDLGPYSEANAVIAQSDGKIVFGGDQAPALQVVNALVGRVSSKGQLDGSFAHQGVYVYAHPHGGGASSIESLAAASGGKIVAAGGDVENSGQHALFIRLNGRGGTDGSFGSGGVLTILSERNSVSGANVGARGLLVLHSGEILGAGSSLDSGLTYSTLWAVTSRGKLDSHQGQGGVVEPVPGLLGGSPWRLRWVPKAISTQAAT